MWDQDFVDEEVPGHVTLGDDGYAGFQFGHVCGSFASPTKNDRVEITKGGLYGIIGFFNGDRSAFHAARK
jgi:hypothetical protein